LGRPEVGRPAEETVGKLRREVIGAERPGEPAGFVRPGRPELLGLGDQRRSTYRCHWLVVPPIRLGLRREIVQSMCPTRQLRYKCETHRAAAKHGNLRWSGGRGRR